MSDYLDPNNEELLQDFFAEAQSQVELLESNLLVLENDPSHQDAVDEIFRAAHTLKGASATVQMSELTEFTHVVEDVLDEIRSSKVQVTGDLIDLLLTAVDITKAMLEARAAGAVYDEDISATTDGLKQFVSGKPAPAAKKRSPRTKKATSSSSGPSKGSAASAKAVDSDLKDLHDAVNPGETLFAIEVRFDESNAMNTVGGIQVFAALKPVATVLNTEPDFDALYSDEYHPTVVYYVTSELSLAELQVASAIPDVTSSVSISEIERDGSSAPATITETAAPVDAPEPDQDEPEVSDEDEAFADDAPEEQSTPQERKRATPSSSVLRVDSRRIDNLLNLVSEAVINKGSFNQVGLEFTELSGMLQSAEEGNRQMVRELIDALPDYLERMQHGESAKVIKREIGENFGGLYSQYDTFSSSFRQTIAKVRSTAQNLGRITGELQEGVMRIRMVPISQIFSRFPRLVRDLTRSLNKQVNLIIEGEDTELDKSVIEDLLDPLIHCVRNSIDHGIEPPAERTESGKTAEGSLTLRASNEGNLIIIEVSDDGRGIDVEAVRKKAIDRGVIHPSKALSDLEAFNLIFDPGFSTAKKISNISGRGVGLDVVRKQIEKLNGSVTVWSAVGEGTRFTVKIPLTLAIIQGLMVRVGKETYAIPITAVIESHRIKPSEIRRLDNYEVFNVREDVISLLRLSRIFGIDTDESQEYHFVVVVGSGDKKVGLIVDSLIGEEDVVIKPLRDRFTNAPGIAGANITGDGRVSLIIDVAQLLELGLKHERDQRQRREAVIGRV